MRNSDRFELTELGRAYVERERALRRELSIHGPGHKILATAVVPSEDVDELLDVARGRLRRGLEVLP